MAYSKNALSTVSDCDTFLAELVRIKSNLEFIKTSSERQIVNITEQSTELPERLTEIDAQIAAARIQDGPDKSSPLLSVSRLQTKKSLIADNYTGYDLMVKQHDINRINQDITELAALTGSIKSRTVDLAA
jgi:hypothetical protein